MLRSCFGFVVYTLLAISRSSDDGFLCTILITRARTNTHTHRLNANTSHRIASKKWIANRPARVRNVNENKYCLRLLCVRCRQGGWGGMKKKTSFEPFSRVSAERWYSDDGDDFVINFVLHWIKFGFSRITNCLYRQIEQRLGREKSFPLAIIQWAALLSLSSCCCCCLYAFVPLCVQYYAVI